MGMDGLPPPPFIHITHTHLLQEKKMGMDGLACTPQALAEMIALIEGSVISGKIGKDILPDLLEGKGNAGVKVGGWGRGGRGANIFHICPPLCGQCGWGGVGVGCGVRGVGSRG